MDAGRCDIMERNNSVNVKYFSHGLFPVVVHGKGLLQKIAKGHPISVVAFPPRRQRWDLVGAIGREYLFPSTARRQKETLSGDGIHKARQADASHSRVNIIVCAAITSMMTMIATTASAHTVWRGLDSTSGHNLCAFSDLDGHTVGWNVDL